MEPDERFDRLADSISKGNFPGPEDSFAGEGLDAHVVDNLMALSRLHQYHRAAGAAEQPKDAELPEWGELVLLRRVGQGAFGEVFHAWDPRLQRPVALKVLHSDREQPEALLDEGRRLAQVRHPNVAQIHGVDEVDGRVGIRMEFVDGPSLDEVVAARGPLAADVVIDVARQLLGALAAVHDAGILHRDVKAKNVVMDGAERVVLTDFGAGTPIAGSSGAPLTGTPRYLAPELLEGASPSAGSDLYATGVLLFHLLTGEYPVVAETLEQLEAAHQAREVRTVREVRTDVPAELAAVVDRALSAKAGERFACAAEMLAALPTASTATAGVAAPTRRPAPRWLALLTLAVIVAIAWQLRSGSDGSSSETVPVSSVPLVSEARLMRGSGPFERLHSGDAVTVGERIHLRVDLAREAWLYVLNRDDHGSLALLFPLPGYALANPVPAGTDVEVPGRRVGRSSPVAWTIGTAGGRERFLVLAAAEPLQEFERMIGSLPVPGADGVLARPLRAEDAASLYRGVTGVAELPVEASLEDAGAIFDLARRIAESGAGERIWIREIVLRNP